jgi:hypothetical protein
VEDIPKTVTWILGGASLPTAVVTLVGLAPRLSAAYPGWVQVAIGLIVAGLFFGSIAGIAYLSTTSRRVSKLKRRIPIICVALGLVATILATAVLALSYQVALSIPDVPRLALTITPTNTELTTVKVKFDADGLQPGNFLVVDVVAVARATELPIGTNQTAPGHRVYRAAIGSDPSGQINSEIQTQLSRATYRLVVAQVYPGPLGVDNSAPNNPDAGTSLCGDIKSRTSRSCAYAEIP